MKPVIYEAVFEPLRLVTLLDPAPEPLLGSG